jgi:hypothetical protein
VSPSHVRATEGWWWWALKQKDAIQRREHPPRFVIVVLVGIGSCIHNAVACDDSGHGKGSVSCRICSNTTQRDIVSKFFLKKVVAVYLLCFMSFPSLHRDFSFVPFVAVVVAHGVGGG